jgi:hypothetical protein
LLTKREREVHFCGNASAKNIKEHMNMNIPTITMSKKDAQAKLLAYRAQLRKRSDAEYQAAVAGYQALVKGTPLVNISDVFAQAGLGADLRPKLAIARADRRQVAVTITASMLSFHAFNRDSWRENGSETLWRRIMYQHPDHTHATTGYALIPMIPADVRPRDALDRCFVLWEVEHWADRPVRSRPDRDPYLLKHIIGDLYAVIAEWDLTELERAIMQGRRA